MKFNFFSINMSYNLFEANGLRDVMGYSCTRHNGEHVEETSDTLGHRTTSQTSFVHLQQYPYQVRVG